DRGTERRRELVRRLRGMRSVADVAREQPCLGPGGLDGAVLAEAPVEARHRDDEQREEEPEEAERRTGVDRAHDGGDRAGRSAVALVGALVDLRLAVARVAHRARAA